MKFNTQRKVHVQYLQDLEHEPQVLSYDHLMCVTRKYMYHIVVFSV